MDEQITVEEVYKLLGERDIMIYRLQREILKLQASTPSIVHELPVRKTAGNGEELTR
jgi:hypothetical protein